MESNEKINYCRYVVPHENENPVNSKVIVKAQNVMCARFCQLRCNTNLNLAPSNWLTNDGNYGIQRSLSSKKHLSSVGTADMLPKFQGEIDLISCSKCVKILLELPYSPKSSISMLVHRVGDTLLIDDFDLCNFMLQNDNYWKWLRSFIYENLSLNDRSFLLKNYCSKESLAKKKLMSKFLYHCLLSNNQSPTNEKSTADIANESSTILQELSFGPLLPEPNIDEHIPGYGDHIFNRNVEWTFEDIRMLIGTDMPIFGGETQPCISLKLRDVREPINVLTGIDYWLDNLMCNVPEVVMCYHLDGLVQKYELIKTEDLPYLENSNFSPKVIRNVAQNILSFLKRNATKTGHTYWLFKGSDDEFVKLYDLTSLCNNKEEDEAQPNSTETQNPFTVPVAMLLYKVAKNMKNMTENVSAKQAGSIKALLDNCIKLLPKEKYPQIVTSSHYILTDLLIPADIDPSSPTFYTNDDESQKESEYGDEVNAKESPEKSDHVQCKESSSDEIALKTVIESNLDKNWKHDSSPPPITIDVKDRCFMALQHIVEGLSCLQFFSQTKEKLIKEKAEMDKEKEKRKIILEELNPKMAAPSVAIPLPYETLKPEAKQINANLAIPMGWKTDPDQPAISSAVNRKTKKKKKKIKKQPNVDEELMDQVEDGRALLLRGKSGIIQSWNVHLKLLLLEKASLTYATLAEQFYHEGNFGTTLKFIVMALNCQNIVAKYMNMALMPRVSLMGRAGDCYLQLALNMDNMDKNLADFNNYSDVDSSINLEIMKEGQLTDSFELNNNFEELMWASLNCYGSALDMLEPLHEKRKEFLRRIGSVRNEMGVKFMHWAQDEYTKYKNEQDTLDDADPVDGKEPLYQTLAKRSYSHLVYGIEAFEKIKDEANLAILLCNMGRYYRFRANVKFPGELDAIIFKKPIYEDAFHHYNRALGILGSKKDNPELWDILTWELSTSTFSWAQLMTDSIETFNDQNSTEIIELWQKALKLCDSKSHGSRETLYVYRKALIHARLGTIFFSLYECNRGSGKKVNSQIFKLCNLHSDKAITILKGLCSTIEDATECLVIQMRQIELHNFSSDDCTNALTRIEHLRNSLAYVLNSEFIFEVYVKEADKITDAMMIRMADFEQLIQNILKKAIKTSMKSTASILTNYFKRIYALTLRKPEKLSGLEMAQHLYQLLKRIELIPEDSPMP